MAILTRDDLGTLKAEALVLAQQATDFAAHVRRDGAENFHPDASDYDELAGMIRRLCTALPV